MSVAVRVVVVLSLAAVAIGCTRDRPGAPSIAPVASQPTPPAADAWPRAIAHETDAAAAPSPLLQPTTNPACRPAFAYAYRFVGTTAPDVTVLFRSVWLDDASRGDYVAPTRFDDSQAAAARCVAIGPHRDFNILNWCCRSSVPSL